jgi:asparagine synthase (glutamine-hydrolysing)
MCGIIGIINLEKEPVSSRLLDEMTSSLSHRGPDETGVWKNGFVGLGHKRLSIIDLQTGKQPMRDKSGNVWITYNGELYNFVELKQELIAKGHSFRTNSDTEVILYSYIEWGDNCVERFRGMFAFGILDLTKKRLFLARDQLGIKPLVYLSTGSCFAFSSEIQALRCLDNIPLDLDLQAIDQYLFLQYIPAPLTIYKHMKKLPPAHRMSISFDGKISGPERYWDLKFEPDFSLDESEWIEALEKVLYDSVKAHLVSDVPFGAFLSGGIDSTAIVTYMAQILNSPVKTFSIGFGEEEFNELHYAEVVAKRCETDHHVEIVKPDALKILPKLVKHYGEPFGDSSALPTYYVSKMARKHVPMVLSGDGGDEAFAGYNTYRGWIQWLKFHRTPYWKKVLYPAASFIFPKRYPKRTPETKNWFRQINYFPNEHRRELWRGEYRDIPGLPIEVFENESKNTVNYSAVNKVQYMDLKTYLPFDILTKVDIASMLNSLEVRTPLVDVRVFEFAAAIPEHYNMSKNSKNEYEGKLLLKKLLKKYYPGNFLHRSKMGFSVPIQKWFGSPDNLQKNILERIVQKDSLINEFFCPGQIAKLVESQAYTLLWLLLFLEEWLYQNK